MDKHRLLMISLLSLVVIAAGCTDTNGEETGDGVGVEIQNFEGDPSVTFENSPTSILLNVENVGGQTAEDIAAEIFNVPLSESESSSQWQLQSGSNPELIASTLREEQDELPAESREQIWQVDAPEVRTDTDYDFQVRMFYTYSTIGETTVELIERQEFREEGPSVSSPTTDSTEGPIELEVRTRTPIQYVIPSDAGSEDEVDPEEDLCVIVRNAGNGVPLHPDAAEEGGGEDYDTSSEYRDSVELTLSDTDRVSFESHETEENSVDVSITGNRGQACFSMDLPSADDMSIREQVPLTMEADYAYYDDSTTTVTVEAN